MKTNLLFLILSTVLSFCFNSLYAQKGNNQIGLISEVIFPTVGDVGGSGYIKGAYGIGTQGQMTLQVGVSKFKTDDYRFVFENTMTQGDKTKVRLVPVLLGYKQFFNQFYIEPQAGYGELGGKIDEGGDWIRPSVGAFYWAAGAGYQFNKIGVGIRYQSAHATGGTKAGIWGNEQFSFVGINLGYYFSLKK